MMLTLLRPVNTSSARDGERRPNPGPKFRMESAERKLGQLEEIVTLINASLNPRGDLSHETVCSNLLSLPTFRTFRPTVE